MHLVQASRVQGQLQVRSHSACVRAIRVSCHTADTAPAAANCRNGIWPEKPLGMVQPWANDPVRRLRLQAAPAAVWHGSSGLAAEAAPPQRLSLVIGQGHSRRERWRGRTTSVHFDAVLRAPAQAVNTPNTCVCNRDSSWSGRFVTTWFNPPRDGLLGWSYKVNVVVSTVRCLRMAACAQAVALRVPVNLQVGFMQRRKSCTEGNRTEAVRDACVQNIWRCGQYTVGARWPLQQIPRRTAPAMISAHSRSHRISILQPCRSNATASFQMTQHAAGIATMSGRCAAKRQCICG